MTQKTQRHYILVCLIFLIFFVISLLTNIIGPLVPEIIDSFKLSLALAGLLRFFFLYRLCCRCPFRPAFWLRNTVRKRL